jgi:quercetin 2,3-dioxygenase
MTVRIIPGEIAARDATTRTVIPTLLQGKWPPFERVAETIASARRRLPPHRHSGVEVLTYIIEGTASYDYELGPGTPVGTGSVQLLTAPGAVSHVINPGKGQTIRWFAVVADLPKGSIAAPAVQFGRPDAAREPADGPVIRQLVGAGAPVRSAIGLECSAVEFAVDGTVFRSIGHSTLGLCYALAGQGTVDNLALEGGEAALVEDSAGIAIHGRSGFRLVVVQAPRPVPMRESRPGVESQPERGPAN